jgi:phage shock protein A
MGFLNKMSDAINAKLNRIGNDMENTSETLDLAYDKQLELLNEVKKGITDIATQRKRMELQKDKMEKNITKLNTQAKTLMDAGNEDLAKNALTQKVNLQQQLIKVDADITKLSDKQTALIKTKDDLEVKISSFGTEKEILKAELDVSKATTKVNETLTGTSGKTGDLQATINRAQEKIDKNNARSEAITELVDDGTLATVGETSLDSQIAKIDIEAQVAAELEALRKK